VAGVLKPVTKAAIKGGILAYQKVKLTLAEAVETVEDIAAEAQAELTEKPATKSAKGKKTAKTAKAD
jgi:hypothetical protein